VPVNDYIRLVDRVPKESDFSSKVGTPIVIDTTTQYAYFMDNAGVIRTLQVGPISVIGAFSNGFSNGFS
jgi:hypothetical protein